MPPGADLARPRRASSTVELVREMKVPLYVILVGERPAAGSTWATASGASAGPGPGARGQRRRGGPLAQTLASFFDDNGVLVKKFIFRVRPEEGLKKVEPAVRRIVTPPGPRVELRVLSYVVLPLALFVLLGLGIMVRSFPVPATWRCSSWRGRARARGRGPPAQAGAGGWGAAACRWWAAPRTPPPPCLPGPAAGADGRGPGQRRRRPAHARAAAAGPGGPARARCTATQRRQQGREDPRAEPRVHRAEHDDRAGGEAAPDAGPGARGASRPSTSCAPRRTSSNDDRCAASSPSRACT